MALYSENHLTATTKRNKQLGPAPRGLECDVVPQKPDPALTLANYSVVIHTTEFLLSVGHVMQVKAASKHGAVLILVSLPGAGQDVLSNDYHVLPSAPALFWLCCCSLIRLFFWGIWELEIAHMDHTHAAASRQLYLAEGLPHSG